MPIVSYGWGSLPSESLVVSAVIITMRGIACHDGIHETGASGELRSLALALIFLIA